jgi:hypothetical protein
MDNCLMWYNLLPTAQYWGSANPGLGFFHVDVEGPEAVQWLNMDNVGVAMVKEGEISAEELEKCFNDMWKVNWFWQIRQLGPKKKSWLDFLLVRESRNWWNTPPSISRKRVW